MTEVMPTGANDVYQVTGDDKVNYLVPAIPDVIVDVDIDRGDYEDSAHEGDF